MFFYKKWNFINIFNPKKELVGGAPLHVKRAETPLSTSFFLGLKCFIILSHVSWKNDPLGQL